MPGSRLHWIASHAPRALRAALGRDGTGSALQQLEPTLAIPWGLSVLTVRPELPGLARVRPLRSRSPALRGARALLETLAAGSAGPGGIPGTLPGVVVLPAAGLELRVNGLPAAPLAVACVGDVLRAGELAWHLALRVIPRIEAPSGDLLGRRCGLCLAELTRDTRVWICPACGEALHLEGSEKPAETRLECARLGDCPTCTGRVQLEPAWIGWPPPGEPGEERAAASAGAGRTEAAP